MVITRLICITAAAKPENNIRALLLFLAVFFLSPTSHADITAQPYSDDVIKPGCINGLRTEQATIERVTDGDTVVLDDQRRVRLIGINAAELNAKSPKLRAAAQQATDQLKAWLPHAEMDWLLRSCWCKAGWRYKVL